MTWERINFKPSKSRSLVIKKGKVVEKFALTSLGPPSQHCQNSQSDVERPKNSADPRYVTDDESQQITKIHIEPTTMNCSEVFQLIHSLWHATIRRTVNIVIIELSLTSHTLPCCTLTVQPGNSGIFSVSQSVRALVELFKQQKTDLIHILYLSGSEKHSPLYVKQTQLNFSIFVNLFRGCVKLK